MYRFWLSSCLESYLRGSGGWWSECSVDSNHTSFRTSFHKSFHLFTHLLTHPLTHPLMNPFPLFPPPLPHPSGPREQMFVAVSGILGHTVTHIVDTGIHSPVPCRISTPSISTPSMPTLLYQPLSSTLLSALVMTPSIASIACDFATYDHLII